MERDVQPDQLHTPAMQPLLQSAGEGRAQTLVAFGQKKPAPQNALICFGSTKVTLNNFRVHPICKETLRFKTGASSS